MYYRSKPIPNEVIWFWSVITIMRIYKRHNQIDAYWLRKLSLRFTRNKNFFRAGIGAMLFKMLFIAYIWRFIYLLPAPLGATVFTISYTSLPLLQLLLLVLLLLGYATIPGRHESCNAYCLRDLFKQLWEKTWPASRINSLFMASATDLVICDPPKTNVQKRYICFRATQFLGMLPFYCPENNENWHVTVFSTRGKNCW